jgi:glyoxylase-like metal-dependent hydrolase (beta-lactamase superfamily II)
MECLATVHHVLVKITPNIALWPGLDPNPLRSFMNSLDKLERLNTSVALPGHRDLIYDVSGRIQELRDHHRQRLQACYDEAGDGCTGYEVCLRIFPRLQNVDDVRLGMVETLAHLEYLTSEGRLERSEESILRYRQV